MFVAFLSHTIIVVKLNLSLKQFLHGLYGLTIFAIELILISALPLEMLETPHQREMVTHDTKNQNTITCYTDFSAMVPAPSPAISICEMDNCVPGANI